MKKKYSTIILTLLTPSILFMSACQNDKSSVQDLKIDAVNAHIRDLTKDFWSSLDKWDNLSTNLGKIVTTWVNAMNEKSVSGNKVNDAAARQTRFYNKYSDVQREPDGTNYHDLLLNDYLKSHDYIDVFECTPGHKQELLERVNNFQLEIDKVSAGLERGITMHWDAGIAPEWVPTVKKLRWFMVSEHLELPHAARDIARIKELVQDCPE